MATFGYTIAAADTLSFATDAMFAVLSSPSDSGSVSKMSVYCVKGSAGSLNATCAIYDADKNLLGTSTQTTITGTVPAWYDFTFSTPVSVVKDTFYYLTIFVDSTGSSATSVFVSVDDPVDATNFSAYYQQTGLTYPTFPSTMTFTNYDGTNAAFSIYATYTPPTIWAMYLSGAIH